MPNHTIRFVLRRHDQDEDQKNKPTVGELSPLRKQYLENRLKDIDYQERQQAHQDHFTTAMYGKKDYTEEKQNILQQLNGNGKQLISEQSENSATNNHTNFTPAAPDEPSDFDRRKKLWENQNKQENPDDQDIFERLNMPDPKKQPENAHTQWKKPIGQSTEAWDRKNEEWRNTPRKDKQHNIIGSQIRCNTTIGRELSKLNIDVQKGVNMNAMIDGMDASGDWANLPTDKNGNPDHKEATKLAKEGYIVIATKKEADHGHAAILTGKEQTSTQWQGKVPEVYGSVNGKTAQTQSISYHWSADDKNNIKYKIYRYKRPI